MQQAVMLPGKVTAWLRAEHRDLTEVMMKYLEVNREIIDGEDGSLFSQLKRDSKQWSTERTPTTTR
jgi:hypothetical protein